MPGIGLQGNLSGPSGGQPWDDYEDPADIIDSQDLTPEEKRELLMQWHGMEQQRTLEQSASVTDDPPMLLRIGRALAFLDPETGASDEVRSDGGPIRQRVPPVEDF